MVEKDVVALFLEDVVLELHLARRLVKMFGFLGRRFDGRFSPLESVLEVCVFVVVSSQLSVWLDERAQGSEVQ